VPYLFVRFCKDLAKQPNVSSNFKTLQNPRGRSCTLPPGTCMYRISMHATMRKPHKRLCRKHANREDTVSCEISD